MAIYDNSSPDIDLGFKATLSFVLAIAALGFGTLISLAMETPIGILFAVTAALLLAILPFVAGWIERSPIGEDIQPMVDMGGFSDTGEAGEYPPPPPPRQPGIGPSDRHP